MNQLSNKKAPTREEASQKISTSISIAAAQDKIYTPADSLSALWTATVREGPSKKTIDEDSELTEISSLDTDINLTSGLVEPDKNTIDRNKVPSLPMRLQSKGDT